MRVIQKKSKLPGSRELITLENRQSVFFEFSLWYHEWLVPGSELLPL